MLVEVKQAIHTTEISLARSCNRQLSKPGGTFSSWRCAGGITPKFLDRIQKTGELLETFLQPESRFHSLLKVRPLSGMPAASSFCVDACATKCT